jgi:hypothetical protein
MENEFTNKGIAILYKENKFYNKVPKPATWLSFREFSAGEIKTLNQN